MAADRVRARSTSPNTAVALRSPRAFPSWLADRVHVDRRVPDLLDEIAARGGAGLGDLAARSGAAIVANVDVRGLIPVGSKSVIVGRNGTSPNASDLNSYQSCG